MEGISTSDVIRFAVACVVIHGVMTVIHRMLKSIAPGLMERQWFKAIVGSLNLVLGALIGLFDYLPGDTRTARVLLGMAAGLLSHYVYEEVRKRISIARAQAVGAVPEKEVPAPESGP